MIIKSKLQLGFIILLCILLLALLIYLCILLYNYFTKKPSSNFMSKSVVTEQYPPKLNIYGEPLQSCRKPDNSDDTGGSWDNSGTCSDRGENDPGVHQICIKKIGRGKNFSKTTGQTGWSADRQDKSHCACLGAWANFVAKMEEDGNTNDKILNCDAIPETALKPKYVNKWRKWNDVSIQGQIDKGLDELEAQCSVNDSNKQEYLDNLLSNLKSSYQ